MKKILNLLMVALMLLPLMAWSQTEEPENKKEPFNQLNERNPKVGFWKERNGELTTRGNYINGLKDGTWEPYLSDELIFRGETYKSGRRNGITLQFDRKGKISNVEHYQNNQLHGHVFIYSPFSSKLLKRQEYENGMLTGLFRSYYDTGKIQEEAFYRANQKHGPSKWFNHEGRLIAIYNYHNGTFEGTQRTFYENDTTSTITRYVNNKQDGEYKEFYRNGKLKLTGNYHNGIKEGAWTEYDETGKAVSVTKYKNGVAK
ncbi:MAG: toxin-antitoxin system YwqK family antitoxin [Bacteroidia bacterium]|nr:toxin-antitoxin system YwqK family antitoxin [Bacteroidia bacterium]